MPYRRRAPVRRPRRRATRGRKPVVSRAVVKYVKRHMPKVEMKRFITFYDESVITTLAGYDPRPLLDLSQGTGAYERIGNEVQAKGMFLRGIVHNNAAITNIFRMVIVGCAGDVDNNLANAELFMDANNAGGTSILTGSAAGLNSMYYPINKAKFDVLYDKVFKLSPSGVDSNDTQLFRKFIKLNRKIRFEGTTTGQYNMNYRYHALVWNAESPDDVTVGTTVEFSCHCTTYYTDA